MLAKDIGTRLVELRGILGWSQTELGEAVDRDRGAIGRWERGKGAPPMGVLYKLTAEYGWPMAMFEQGGPRPSAVVTPPQRLEGARSPTGATIPVDHIERVLLGAVGRVMGYAETDSPIPWREVARLLAEISQALGLSEGGTTTRPAMRRE